MTWHIITGEFDNMGGVADYTRSVSCSLAEQGEQVVVWHPGQKQQTSPAPGVNAIGLGSHFDVNALSELSRALDAYPAPRRLLVQWVPHSFGYRSVNLPFCLWLANRARRGDRVEIMFHETFMPITGNWKQRAAAIAQRGMTSVLLHSAGRVWMSIQGWEPVLRSFTMGAQPVFSWLPVPSNIPVETDAAQTAAIRGRYLGNASALIGHFGSYGTSPQAAMLKGILRKLSPADANILLFGRGSDEFLQTLAAEGFSTENIFATGSLDAREISLHLAACDFMIQPFPDGISSRRGSAIAALAHGVPVVSTFGELSEPFWPLSDAVLLAPANELSEVLSHSRRLIADAALRSQLSESAKKLYSDCFDLSHTISKLRAAV